MGELYKPDPEERADYRVSVRLTQTQKRFLEKHRMYASEALRQALDLYIKDYEMKEAEKANRITPSKSIRSDLRGSKDKEGIKTPEVKK